MMNQYEIDYQQGYDKANDKWLDRIKEVKEEIKNISIEVQTNYENYEVVETDNILTILDELIKEGED